MPQPRPKRRPKAAPRGAAKAAPKTARRSAGGGRGGSSDSGNGDRLQKVLAAAGLASRRECEALIEEGRVEVDGEVVTRLGVRVDPFKQRIAVDGEPLPRQKRVYYAVNKPEGVVCTARDPSGRPRVTDLIPPEAGRVFNVGRLDLASDGLILLTNDGELANRLTHPRHGVEKIYHVQVSGLPTPEALAEVRKGVYLAEGKTRFARARIKSRRKNGAILEVTLDEGRNREIRRVLARVGHKVQRLTRIAVGPVRLGDLPSGAHRQLTPQEVKALREASDSVRDAPAGGAGGARRKVARPGGQRNRSASATAKGAGRRKTGAPKRRTKKK